MDVRAKQLCQEFFLRQINEAKRMYDRVAVCHCEHIGGEYCTCAQHESSMQAVDGSASPSIQSNGLNGNDTMCTYNRDSALPSSSRSTAERPRRFVNNSEHVWRLRMMSLSGSTLHIKPFVKQTSLDEHSYDGLTNPFVIVINNVNFKGCLVPRNGAQADMENVKRFLKIARFSSCDISENLDRNSMRKVFERTRENPDLVDYDGLICFILSHGSEKGILASDNAHIQVEEITSMFGGDQCQSLATKPKLFFIQACRGDVDDRGFPLVSRGIDVVPDNELDLSKVPVILPSDADFLVAYSTTKGKTSYRQFIADSRVMENHMPSMGSWFISCLTQVILEYSHEDLLTMLTRVNKAMCELYTIQAFKQVSCYHSVLTKKVYFPTIQQNTYNGANYKEN